MTYKCKNTFESTKGVTYLKGRIIPLYVFTKLNNSEQNNFIPISDII